jgi:hypothetical protein
MNLEPPEYEAAINHSGYTQRLACNEYFYMECKWLNNYPSSQFVISLTLST